MTAVKHHTKERPLRFAYADPPYLGQCARYGHDHRPIPRMVPSCWNDVDTHHALIVRLQEEFPDGWALSLTSPSLRELLPLVPNDARVAAWGKPYAAFKPGVRPAYSWEPLIFVGGRNPSRGFRHAVRPDAPVGTLFTPSDFLYVRSRQESGLAGSKPEAFCRWVLDLLGFEEGDKLVDLFPGTRVMSAVSRQMTATL